MSTMDSESTMLGFAGNNDLISGNQVDAGSADYYNQVTGISRIYGLTGFYEQDSLKASYISAYVPIFLWKIHTY